jgi:hypothetical protein
VPYPDVHASSAIQNHGIAEPPRDIGDGKETGDVRIDPRRALGYPSPTSVNRAGDVRTACDKPNAERARLI